MKKTLSMLLALVMIFSLLPTATFAADEAEPVTGSVVEQQVETPEEEPVEEAPLMALPPMTGSGDGATDYLTFTSDSAFKVELIKKKPSAPDVSLEYSTDKENWTIYDNTNRPAVSAGASGGKYTISFRNKSGSPNSAFASTNQLYNYFSFSSDSEKVPPIAASGNIMTLLNYQNPDTVKMGDYAFRKLFSGCTALTSAPELPATELTKNCYSSMFSGCTSLTSAPALPATTLADSCYHSMFSGCTSLTGAPTLSATTLTEACYAFMFSGCTSLTEAPKLSAEKLANTCYENMFNGCTGLCVTKVENAADATWTIPYAAVSCVTDMTASTATGSATVALPAQGSTNYYKVEGVYDLTGGYTGLPDGKTGGVTFTVSDSTVTLAAKDAVVTATATAVTGYTAALTSSDVTFTTNANGTATFTMPEKAVTVTATYTVDPTDVCFIDKDGNGAFDGGETKYATVHKAINDAAKGQTVVMIANSTERVVIDKNTTADIVTLDLNGHALIGPGGDNVIMFNKSSAELTIKDSNPNQAHYYTYSSSSVWKLNDNADEEAKNKAITLDAVDSKTKDGTLVLISGGAITGGNRSNKNGGGIYAAKNATLKLIGINVVGNTSTDNGGGIYGNEGAIINCSACNIVGNTVTTEDGGALYVYGTTTATNTQFVGNSAMRHGGAVYVAKGKTFDADTCTFSNNKTPGINGYGGALYINCETGKVSKATITDCTFENNNAFVSGGGIYNNYGTAIITGGSYNNNSAQYAGVLFNDNGTATITGGSYKNNSVTRAGGVIYNDGATLNITNGTFESNTATSDENDTTGGFLHSRSANSSGSSVTITGTTIKNNQAQNGGAIYNVRYNSSSLYPSTITITNCEITGNTASVNGGGVYNVCNLIISGATNITGNKKGTGDTAADNNIYLKSGSTIAVGSSGLEVATLIGVTLESGAGNVTSAASADYSGCFKSDSADYVVKNDKSSGDAAQVVKLVPAPVKYLDKDGKEQTCSDYTVITDSTTELKSTVTSGWYVVKGVDVKTGSLTVTGDVHLILTDGAKLTVTAPNDAAERQPGKDGIVVSSGGSLTVYGQTDGSGILNATGGNGGDYQYTESAGAGGAAVKGTVIVCGGTVNVTGGEGGNCGDDMAGAGGDGICGDATVWGGALKATGGKGGYSVNTQHGTGGDGIKGSLTVTSGAVRAIGGDSGNNGDGGNKAGGNGIEGKVAVSGGTVEAIGGSETVKNSGFGISTSDITTTGMIVKAGGTENPTDEITDTDSDGTIADELKGKRYVTIEKAAYAAQVIDTDGTTVVNSYATVQEAITAATAGQTVKMLADTEEAVTVADKTLTLDLNGKTLSYKNGYTLSSGVRAKVTVIDTSADKTGTILATGNAAVEVAAVKKTGGGTFTLAGGKLCAIGTADCTGNLYGLQNTGAGTQVLSGGTIEVTSAGTNNFAGVYSYIGTTQVCGTKISVKGTSATATGKNNSGVQLLGTAAFEISTGSVDIENNNDNATYGINSGSSGALTLSGGKVTAQSTGKGAVVGVKSTKAAIALSGTEITGKCTGNGNAYGMSLSGEKATTITGGKAVGESTGSGNATGISVSGSVVIDQSAGAVSGTASGSGTAYGINTTGTGAITLTGGTVTGTSDGTGSAYGVCTSSAVTGDITVNGCTVSGKASTAGGGKVYGMYILGSGAFAVKSGSVTGTQASDKDCCGVYVGGTRETTVSGGGVTASASGNGAVYGMNIIATGAITLTGGTVTGTSDGSGAVYGVATSSATTGDITLDSCVISTEVTSAGGGDVYGMKILGSGKFDMKSGSVTAKQIADKDCYGIAVGGTRQMTLSGGSISAETSGDKGCHALRTNDSASLTMSDGTVKATATGTYHSCGICNNGTGKVSISGGEVISKAVKTSDSLVLNALTAGKYEVTGGKFDGKLSVGKGNFTITGGKFSKDPTNYLGIACCAQSVTGDEPYLYTISNDPVAHDGSHGYDSVQKAINNNTTATVTMLKDSKEDVTVVKGKTITLDLGNKTLTGTGTGSVITVRGDVTIADTAPSKGTAGIGIITGGKYGYGGGIYINDTGTLTLAGGKITGNTATVKGGGVYSTTSNITVSGNLEISGNTVGGNANNLYLKKNQTVTVATAGLSNAAIGVTLESGTGAVTSNGAKSDTQYFTADISDYKVLFLDKDSEVPAHLELQDISTYKFTVTAPETLKVNEKYTTASVQLSPDTVKGAGYDHVLIKVEMTAKPEGSAPQILAKDTLGKEWNIADVGQWGPVGGFPITKDYDATTPLTLKFDKAGDYTATFTLVDLDNSDAVICQSSATITVSKNAQNAPDVGVGYTVDYAEETITPDNGYEVSTGNGDNFETNQLGSETAIDFTKTYYVRLAEDDIYLASPETENTFSRPSTPAAPEVQSKTDTAVTLKAVTGCEYSMDGTIWKDSNEFSGLTAGTEYTFYQRVKATETSFRFEASSLTVKTKATDNRFSGTLKCDGFVYGGTPKPSGVTAKYGTVVYLYSMDGKTWDTWANTNKGSEEYQVKAVVYETTDYNGCESAPVSFNVQASLKMTVSGDTTAKHTDVKTYTVKFTGTRPAYTTVVWDITGATYEYVGGHIGTDSVTIICESTGTLKVTATLVDYTGKPVKDTEGRIIQATQNVKVTAQPGNIINMIIAAVKTVAKIISKWFGR